VSRRPERTAFLGERAGRVGAETFLAHCPGDETAAASTWSTLHCASARDRIGGINAGDPGHRRIAARCLTRGRRLDRAGELHLRVELPFPGLDFVGRLRRDGYGGGEG